MSRSTSWRRPASVNIRNEREGSREADSGSPIFTIRQAIVSQELARCYDKIKCFRFFLICVPAFNIAWNSPRSQILSSWLTVHFSPELHRNNLIFAQTSILPPFANPATIWQKASASVSIWYNCLLHSSKVIPKSKISNFANPATLWQKARAER